MSIMCLLVFVMFFVMLLKRGHDKDANESTASFLKANPLIKSGLASNNHISSSTDGLLHALTCSPGECVTELTTGLKVCPDNEDGILPYDPIKETCNFPQKCNSIRTPIAQDTAGNCFFGGICPTDSHCKCINYISCRKEISCQFKYDMMAGEAKVSVMDLSRDPPPSDSKIMCTLPSTLVPGLIDEGDASRESINKYLAGPNPKRICRQGSLAIASQSGNTEKLKAANFYQIACVNADPCKEPDQILNYDPTSGLIKCIASTSSFYGLPNLGLLHKKT